MSLMPERMTPKRWGLVALAVIALGAAAYLIYDNTRDPGQGVKTSGSAPQPATTPSGGVPGSAAPGHEKVIVPAGSAGPQRVAPK
jgi:hypothetical protein